MNYIYSHLVPISVAYTNINHVLVMNEMKPEKMYLTFWDNYALENYIFDRIGVLNKPKQIEENIDSFKKIINNLNIPHHTLIFSEASKRIVRDRDYYNLLNQILAELSLQQLSEGYKINKQLFSEMTISNIITILVDYLIATFLDKIYPELSLEKPTIYLTSERFKIFYPAIEKILRREYSSIQLPQPVYTSIPFFNCPKRGILPSAYMGFDEIRTILREHFNNKDKELSISEVEEFVKMLARVIDKFKFKNETLSVDAFLKKLKLCQKEQIVDLFAQSLFDYYLKIEAIISASSKENKKDSLLIRDPKTFKQKVKPLNELKLRILSLCNGNNSSLDISKILSLNLSTVSAYIGQLKQLNLLTEERKPLRKIDHIVINLKGV